MISSQSSSSSSSSSSTKVIVNCTPTPILLPSSPKGVIFDMDGTLVEHVIDFAEMRQRIYAVADADPRGKDLERDCVLTLANKLSPEGQEECQFIFDEITRNALKHMKLMPGGADLVRYLRDRGIKLAIFTKNREENAQIVSDSYLREVMTIDGEVSCVCVDDDALFYPIIGRDSKISGGSTLRSKPFPDGILHICNVWGCDPAHVIMVGDNENDDITAANRAGCGGSVLLTQKGGTQFDTHSGFVVGDTEEEIRERIPSLRVESMYELKSYLEALLDERDIKIANKNVSISSL
jgi:phosphoglycolate phosphatase-like HAD superfamily hydrolase